MDIRELHLADIPSIVELAKKVWNKHLDPEKLKKMMDQGKFYGAGAFLDQVLIAFQTTDPVKSPGGDKEGYHCYMGEACIIEEYQNDYSLQKQLIQKFLELVPPTEVTVISASVDPMDKERIMLLLSLQFEFRTDEPVELELVWA